ncbi:MAG: Rha family transcriptional regulator [Alteromonadaceae bacterium]|nr:Rha family transcriptional regulator [Alteromonadaceae bacterium]
MTQQTLNLPNPPAAREALFMSTDGKPFTTSRAVAERFGKQHKEVLRGIKKLLSDMPDPAFTERNFALSEYSDPSGRKLPQYELSHDAFALVVMGFTGRDALAWKIAFLQAFNVMEAELRAREQRFANALDQVRPALRPVVEGTEQGQSRSDIAGPLGKSPASVTYHRRRARDLGLLPSLH